LAGKPLSVVNIVDCFWSGVGRFKEGMALSEEEVAAFEEYFYHITAARGSGEHALRHILKPFAWAHNPLEPQLQHLKVCLPLFIVICPAICFTQVGRLYQ